MHKIPVTIKKIDPLLFYKSVTLTKYCILSQLVNKLEILHHYRLPNN